MNSVKVFAATALFAACSYQAVAENRTPAEMALPVSPDYRNVDVDATRGAQFVWVHRIEGRDNAGNSHVLFSDMQGALLPLEQLNKAEHLINPLDVSNKGTYRALQLTLADNMLSVGANGMKRMPLPQGVNRNVALQGDLTISKFEVSSNGLTLQEQSREQLALLNR